MYNSIIYYGEMEQSVYDTKLMKIRTNITCEFSYVIRKAKVICIRVFTIYLSYMLCTSQLIID